MQKNEKWLIIVCMFELLISFCSLQSGKRSSVGRPQKNLEVYRKSKKKKKIDSIVNSHSVSELAFAVLSQLHKDEKRSAAILIKEVIENPDKAYTK